MHSYHPQNQNSGALHSFTAVLSAAGTARLPRTSALDTCHYGTQCLSLAYNELCPLEHALYLDICFLFTSICQFNVIRHLAQPIHHYCPTVFMN